MKFATILGTRPEIIRLSIIIKKLEKLADHFLIHTGQNYDERLNDVFFQELKIKKPDYYLNATGEKFGHQLSLILKGVEEVFEELKPDKILVLGDTNSALSTIIAERMGIPVYHMEAGNRCFDFKVPEEINRKIVDSIASFAFPYTSTSKENLLKEGIPKNRIYVSGNPIYEVLMQYMEKIENSPILSKLNLEKGNYFLATIHRAENVDTEGRLKAIMESLDLISKEHNLPIIFSVHPRTRSKLDKFQITINNDNLIMMEPFGFFDFIKLEKNAKLVLTDSGTVQEECCIFKIPAVTIRDTTERPETVQCGSNIVSGLNPQNVLRCVKVMLASNRDWICPDGYLDNNVSDKVIKYLMGWFNVQR